MVRDKMLNLIPATMQVDCDLETIGAQVLGSTEQELRDHRPKPAEDSIAARRSRLRRPASLAPSASGARRPAAAGRIFTAVVTGADRLAIRGDVSTEKLRGDVCGGAAVSWPSPKGEASLEETAYEQKILTVDHLLANTDPSTEDPGRGSRFARRVRPQAARLGMGILEETVE